MFTKTVTEQYPEDKRPTAPRYHGRHVLNRHADGLEKCVGCELCAWACPADAIYVEGADNTEEERFSPGERYGAVYQINYLRCIFCGLCIEACPTRALTMTNEYELADDSRQDLIFTKDQLLAPLLPGMEQPPHPMRLGDDEKAYYVRDAGRARRASTRSTASERDADCRRRLRRARDDCTRRVLFWILAPIAVGAALGLVLARSAVHAAMLLAAVMLCLAAFYTAENAPFLAVVQVVVYTGAVLMLFLFVLMLIGVDSTDSLIETLRGQRLAARRRSGSASPSCCSPRSPARWPASHPKGVVGAEAGKGNVAAIAQLLFSRYVFAFEATSALLITAGLGAMVLAHREPTERRLHPAASGCSSGSARGGAGIAPLPGPACTPTTTRSTPPRCCPTAASRSRSVPELPAGVAAPHADADRKPGAGARRRCRSPTTCTCRRCCSRSARSACSCAATRSSCSCASS